MLPEGYLAAVYEEMREEGAVCVADEVQCGFGRVGSAFWAFQLQAVVPDVITCGEWENVISPAAAAGPAAGMAQQQQQQAWQQWRGVTYIPSSRPAAWGPPGWSRLGGGAACSMVPPAISCCAGEPSKELTCWPPLAPSQGLLTPTPRPTPGKPMGNGFPMAGVITTPAIARSFASMEFFATTGGCNAAAAFGLAVLDVIEEEGLQTNAARVGGHVLGRLRALQAAHPEVVGDVRGQGLMLGAEVVTDAGSRCHAPVLARHIKQRCKDDHRVLLSTEGPFGNIIKVGGGRRRAAASGHCMVWEGSACSLLVGLSSCEHHSMAAWHASGNKPLVPGQGLPLSCATPARGAASRDAAMGTTRV